MDVYTIYNELGKVDGLRIAMVGDLKHGRTVHSLARLLCHFDVSLEFVAPASLQMPEDVCQDIAASGISYSLTEDINESISHCDVLYVTRLQKVCAAGMSASGLADRHQGAFRRCS